MDLDPTATPCALVEGDLWFSQRPAAVEQAKQHCRSCPLTRECLQVAVARQEPWGVWGGELLDRGVVVPRKRPMGRPRNDEVAARRAEEAQVRARRTELAALRRSA